MLDIQHLQTCCHQDINLQVHPGEAITISGASGCGKTVLLRAISDLDPHEGAIRLDHIPQSDTPAPRWRQSIGFLPSEYFFWTETAADCFEATHLTESFANALSRLGLDHSILNRPVNQLSAGEKQRLALLRLLQNEPRCLLLDEACSHLDHDTTQAVEAMISDYQQQARAMAIWISHDAQQRQRVAKRHFYLTHTGLAETGT